MKGRERKTKVGLARGNLNVAHQRLLPPGWPDARAVRVAILFLFNLHELPAVHNTAYHGYSLKNSAAAYTVLSNKTVQREESQNSER